ncbi:unnamed protein product, partial [Brenthis ino]
MPRVRRSDRRRRSVYWWSPEIAQLRATCNRHRRAYVRCRRRNGLVPDLESELRVAYRSAKKALQLAISQAKAAARQELLAGLDRDPWGRPYISARNKLCAHGAPVTETTPPDVLLRLVGGLFPESSGHVPPVMCPPSRREGVDEFPPITEGEMELARDKLRAKRTAPGTDGIPGRVLCIALEYLGGDLRDLFNACLRVGQFPKIWKEGLLCLLPKEGRPLDSPSAYRPIVMLSEVGKLFERILVARLTQHLEEVGPGLSEAQFGFRAGRSTVDALNALKVRSLAAVEEGDVLLAVSLDVANAFNTLPFETLREALRYHEVPLYLRRVLDEYLRDRQVVWTGADGVVGRRRVDCGVPQGAVLGLVLWNLGYDWLLRCPLLPGLGVIAYADDTLVTARGRSYEEAVRLATVGTNLVVDRIGMLGLRVSVSKTEALLFHGPRRGAPRNACLRVQGRMVEVRAQMKYLGLTLDGRWTFRVHFAQLTPRLIGAASALGRLLPNVGGPGSHCRRLYAGIVRSMALYGAPVWIDALSAPNRAQLRKAQRVLAVRAVRGYRTVSFTAATLLAGDPPWELQAEVLAEVYQFRASERARGERPAREGVARIRRLADEALIRRWWEDLGTPAAGSATVGAVRPFLSRWVRRPHGVLTFRLTQMLTGHGCFGKYLCQVARREPLPACHECGASEDTSHHTLAVCAAWAPQRHALMAVVGGDLSLRSVVGAMLRDERSWSAMVSFSEAVISLKETAEREREANALADPLRRRRLGGRRRRYAHLLPPP